MSQPARLQVETVDDTWIIRFSDRMLFDDNTVRIVNEELGAAIPNDGKPLKLVLDFTNVELISSSLLGKLILLQRRIDSSGGRLRLCELRSTVQSVFRTSNLDRLFLIDRDRRASLEGF